MASGQANYRKGLRNSVYGLWAGVLDKSDFHDAMSSTIERWLTVAWNEGAAECGISPEELTVDEHRALLNAIDSELGHLSGYGDYIIQNSKANGGKRATVFKRLEGWIRRYKDLTNRAKTMACRDKKLEWVLGPTQESCRTCIKLNGKVKRASYWEAAGLHPQDPPNDRLECNGWNCLCELRVTDKPISKGPLPGGRGPVPVKPVEPGPAKIEAPSGPDTTTERMDQFMVDGLDYDGHWSDSTGTEAEKQAKHEIVSYLSQETGLDYAEVNEFVAQWADTSGDRDMRSLAIQQAASKEFGIPLSEYTQGHIDRILAKIERERAEGFVGLSARQQPLMDELAQRQLLKTMYGDTQAQLAKHGFKPGDTIRLRRGVQLPTEKIPDLKAGQTIGISGNSIESWSLGSDAAQEFAETHLNKGHTGFILEADIPVEMIISTSRTGLGQLDEGEITVMGSILGNAKVIDVWEKAGWD